jgi:ABC-type transport system involved in cytochrome bd biosynthesis fused ATPase/permease subunit
MEGKTVLLSTHEVTLLREMDVVYVVNNATVKDVSHYGGVENYIFSLLTHRPITEIGQ